jgi:ribosomal protein S18 acetylase RimI-like enzyme
MERTEVVCRALTLREVRKLGRIRSGFETDRVFRLDRSADANHIRWRLYEARVIPPFQKRYDSGRLDELLESYEETVRPEKLCFAGAFVAGEARGLITWQLLRWNNTLWLLDIRTDEQVRRRGIGSALLEYLKSVAKENRARGISVETQINNYPAVCFYRKHGFGIAGFHDHLYTNHDLATQDVALFLFWEAG